MFRRDLGFTNGNSFQTEQEKTGVLRKAMKDTVNPVYCTLQSMYGGDTVRILVTYLYSCRRNGFGPPIRNLDSDQSDFQHPKDQGDDVSALRVYAGA